jgi:ADP-heptose:LPS heptosyltransferase
MAGSRLERAIKSRAHALASRLLAAPRGVAIPARVQRILVTKQHNQMGDFILASPLFANLARAFPGATIDYLASPVQAEVAGLVPEIRRVWLLEGRGIFGRGRRVVSLVRSLRQERYDLALSVVTVSYSTTSALLLALSGARFRVAGRIAASPGGRSLFHREIGIPEGFHETDRALAHLAALGLAPGVRAPRLVATREEIETGRLLLGALGWSDGDLLVGIHPGAGKAPNRWPAPYFGEAARRLLTREGIRILLFAGPKEEPLLDAMGLPAGPRIARMTGLSLRQVAGLMSRLTLYLGNDTGTLHLAAALGVPTIGLYGPTDPAVWAPVTPLGRTVRAPNEDLARLEPAAVEAQIETMLVKLYSES